MGSDQQREDPSRGGPSTGEGTALQMQKKRSSSKPKYFDPMAVASWTVFTLTMNRGLVDI